MIKRNIKIVLTVTKLKIHIIVKQHNIDLTWNQLLKLNFWRHKP